MIERCTRKIGKHDFEPGAGEAPRCGKPDAACRTRDDRRASRREGGVHLNKTFRDHLTSSAIAPTFDQWGASIGIVVDRGLLVECFYSLTDRCGMSWMRGVMT